MADTIIPVVFTTNVYIEFIMMYLPIKSIGLISRVNKQFHNIYLKIRQAHYIAHTILSQRIIRVEFRWVVRDELPPFMFIVELLEAKYCGDIRANINIITTSLKGTIILSPLPRDFAASILGRYGGIVANMRTVDSHISVGHVALNIDGGINIWVNSDAQIFSQTKFVSNISYVGFISK